MVRFSAFADEIAPDLKTQMAVCAANGVRCIDVRGIDNINVSKFTVAQAKAHKRQMDGEGFTVPCIGSPLGKVRIDEAFAAHLDLTRHCCDIARAFDSPFVRIFSFYGREGGNILNHRQQVMDNLAAMVAAATDAGIVLLHENESAIYGEKPDQVKDIFATIASPNLKGIFDPSNFVAAGVKPFDEGWKCGLAELTDYFHIKDKVPGEAASVPAGEGAGQIAETLADAKARGFDGFLTLEPHLKAAGQFKGFTGPDLFVKAVDALKRVCEQVGMEYGRP